MSEFTRFTVPGANNPVLSTVSDSTQDPGVIPQSLTNDPATRPSPLVDDGVAVTDDDADIEVDDNMVAMLTRAATFRYGADRQLEFGSGGTNGNSLGQDMALAFPSNAASNTAGFFQVQQQQPVNNLQFKFEQQERNDDENGDEGDDDDPVDLPEEDEAVWAAQLVQEIEELGTLWKRRFTSTIISHNNEMFVLHNRIWNLCKGGSDAVPCYILGCLNPETYALGDTAFDDKYYTWIDTKLIDLLGMDETEFDKELDDFEQYRNSIRQSKDQQLKAMYEREMAEQSALKRNSLKNRAIMVEKHSSDVEESPPKDQSMDQSSSKKKSVHFQ